LTVKKSRKEKEKNKKRNPKYKSIYMKKAYKIAHVCGE
jgi:hypothetical protein